MTVAHLASGLMEEIAHHGEETYPDECCGFLVGTADNDDRHVTRIERAANEYEGERRRRFVIRPEELQRVEDGLEGTSLFVLGFYHSHPDHPARPSTFDQDHAWPWYVYLVQNVERGRAGEIGAFELEAEAREFRAIPLRSAAPLRTSL
ncbi:MAG: M67 family metallopeptidase [Thermoplasmata archaeon]|nr:M67 family metallopeptidase [Thermoplasmata archaeon]